MITDELVMDQSQAFSLPPPPTAAATPSLWLLPPADLELKTGEAHVWLSRLDEEKAEGLEHILSADERARAEGFRFPHHKKQFIVARGLLRIILGKYLGVSPQRLPFKYNKYGKPSIDEELLPSSAIKFNLSHSEGFALYAVTTCREIGVDLERVTPSVAAHEGMAALCLTARETARFRTLSGRARDLFFLDCWTRKEAYLKACGSGLSLPANQIEASLLSEFPNNFFKSEEPGSPRRSYSCQKLPPIPGYAAALAIEGTSPQLKFWLQPNV